MPVLKKSEVATPDLSNEEVVAVPELGGDVIVRGPGLSERLELATPGDAQSRSKFAHISKLLAVSVLDADYEPIFTVKQWEAFGRKGKNLAAAMRLWDIAWRLGDFDGAQAAKNEEAPTSA
jgi:hypothetical protein